MKKTLLIFTSILVAAIILVLLYFFVISPWNDALLFNKAIDTGEVSYCQSIKSYFFTPGPKGSCIAFVAQKNDDPLICEEGNILQKDDCYAMYAYYKKDAALCTGPTCSKTLFDYCTVNGCETVDDVK